MSSRSEILTLVHIRHMRLVHQAWCKPNVLRNGKSSGTISIQLSSTQRSNSTVLFILFFFCILASISLYDNRSSNSSATKYKLSLVALGPHQIIHIGVGAKICFLDRLQQIIDVRCRCPPIYRMELEGYRKLRSDIAILVLNMLGTCFL